MQRKTSDHWNKHALQWSHIGPPLRPVKEDTDWLEQQLHVFFPAEQTETKIILLGVTPELAHIACVSPATRLVAVDRSMAMIHQIWTSPTKNRSAPICADWCKLPFPAASASAVIGDGCFTLLPFSDAYQALLQSICNILAPGGIFAMRFFSAPEIAESTDSVFSDLFAGKIGNFHIFKWRLAMAIQDRSSWSVPVHQIWTTWHETVSDTKALSQHLGWPLAEINTIEAYRDAPARYSFPPLSVLRQLLAQHFTELAIKLPSYELGERCPTLLMRART